MSERILLERERVPLHTFIKLHLVKFTVYSGLKKFQYSGCVLIKSVSMCYCKYLGLRTVIIKQFYFCFHCSFKPHHLSSFIYDFNDKYHPQDFSNAFKTNKWTKKTKRTNEICLYSKAQYMFSIWLHPDRTNNQNYKLNLRVNVSPLPPLGSCRLVPEVGRTAFFISFWEESTLPKGTQLKIECESSSLLLKSMNISTTLCFLL